jgi:hypothetical protein
VANRKTVAQAANAQPPQQAEEISPKLDVDDPEFLNKITEQLGKRHEPTKHVLLNIPIWGWTGDGKTCALLTATHFCDPAQHPLSFALITNTDELLSLESSAEDYKGLNLVGTAVSTTERLRGLAERFIDSNDWPPGTDEPSSYILAIRNVTATLGYVLFPDLKGGSYRELDDAARNVLQRAHAAILLVNPETYHKKTTDGKRYRDEILATLHEFSQADVPVCVMITKADLYQGQDQAADETHKQLTILIDQQRSLQALLCRVSVIGPGRSQDGNPLPDAVDRHPDTMVKAWIWVVAQALCRPGDDIRQHLPLVNLGRIGNQSVDLKLRTIPELRQIGDFSGSPGRILCASNDDPRSKAFTFLSEKGELLETLFEAGVQPQFKAVGNVPEWDQADVRCYYIGGEFLIGRKSSCNFIWQGTKGGELMKAPFPFEMASWVPVTARRILSIDAAGRLHSISYAGGRWSQTDFIETFISPTPYLTCAFVERSSHALVFNGETVEGVAVGADGQLGKRVAPGYTIKFDTPRASTNRLGLCLALSTSGAGRLSGPEKAVEIGPVKADAEEPIALAPDACVVAVITPDLHIVALSVVGAHAVQTATSHSPQIDANPESMVWAQDGDLLAVSFEDRTWRIYRPFGLSI